MKERSDQNMSLTKFLPDEKQLLYWHMMLQRSRLSQNRTARLWGGVWHVILGVTSHIPDTGRSNLGGIRHTEWTQDGHYWQTLMGPNITLQTGSQLEKIDTIKREAYKAILPHSSTAAAMAQPHHGSTHWRTEKIKDAKKLITKKEQQQKKIQIIRTHS